MQKTFSRMRSHADNLGQVDEGNRHFAMKLQPKAQAHSQWQACSELVALQRATHPFIVRLEQAFQTPQFFALLLELCPNGDINKAIIKHRDDKGNRSGLPVKRVARYAGQALVALTFLHERFEVVVRDIKPENVLLSKRDEAKLADFGLAAYVRSKGDGNAKRRMGAMGTQGFVAPELVLGDYDSDDEGSGGGSFESDSGEGAVDPFKTDAFSFGVMLEMMLLGEDVCQLAEDPDDDSDGEQEGGVMIPCLGSEVDNFSKLEHFLKSGRISPEAHDLLLKLTSHKPAKRMRLADRDVREHTFFLKELGISCLDDLLPTS